MAPTTAEVPFSQLVQQPRETVAKLEESPRRQLRLERRDGRDLILQSADRAEAKDAALSMTSPLFFSFVKNDKGARALLLALPDVFRGSATCQRTTFAASWSSWSRPYARALTWTTWRPWYQSCRPGVTPQRSTRIPSC